LGIFDSLLSPDVQALISGQQPAQGLLSGASGPQRGSMGLLAPAWKPGENENFMTSVFGNPNDPNDPRGLAMSRLAVGLMRGDFASGIEGANKAFGDVQEQSGRRALAQLGLVKDGVQLQKLLDDRQRDQRIKTGIAAIDDQEQRGRTQGAALPYLDKQPGDEFGPSAIGGVPMFGMGGAARFGSQPIGAYTPPVPSTSMPAPANSPGARSFTVGAGNLGNAGNTGAPGSLWNALGTQPNATRQWADRLRKTASVYAQNGDMTTATKMLEEAGKLGPEFTTEFRQVIDPQTGSLINVMVAKDGTVARVPFGVKPDMTMENLGGSVQAIDRNAVTPGQTFNKTATPGELMTNARALQSHQLEVLKADPFGTLGINKNPPAGAGATAGLSGDEYLATLPPGVASQVKGIAEGKIQISPYTIRTPQGQALLQMAMQYDPGTDQTTYQKRNATAKDAASGKLAQSNNALNTVAGHLSGLADSADALNNTRFPLVNAVTNWAQINAGDPRVRSFNMNVQGVANELERAYRGAGGSEADIKLWRDTLSSANSPDQFKAVFSKGAEMLQSKLEANQAQYEQGMAGRGGGYSAITPTAADALARLREQSDGNPQSGRIALPRRSAAGTGTGQALSLPPNATASSLQAGQAYQLPNGQTATWDGFHFKVVK
jgi:hypothetical protein